MSSHSRLTTPDFELPQKHEPGRAAGFVREGEGGACAALHGLWERAPNFAGAMLSAWLTSRLGARIHRCAAPTPRDAQLPFPSSPVHPPRRRAAVVVADD